MSDEKRQVFEFGPFHVDTLNRQLMRNGEVVPLKAKAVDTLLLLIEKRGEVVEKDDLMKLLWPDSFVEESNLTQNIYTLRKALGDPSYIKTVSRRGYRFVAEVRELAGSISAAQQAGTEGVSARLQEAIDSITVKDSDARLPAPRNRRSVRRSRRAFYLGIALLIILLSVAVAVLWLRNSRIPFETVRLAKFTTTGKALKAAISPDGKYAGYVLSESGQQSIWLRQLETGKELQIAPPQVTEFYGLTFSHDGNYIFYVSQARNHVGILYEVPSLGGTPDKLLEDIDSPVTCSPDNKQLAFIRFTPGAASIVIANVTGGAERTLVTTHLKDPFRIAPNGVLPPSWSPDGTVIACPVSINGNQWDQAIYGFQTKDGTARQLTSNHWPAIGRIEWSPDGHGLLATVIESENTSEQQIYFLPYPEGKARRITNDLMDYRDLGVTADARTLITIQSEKKANIWITTAGDFDHPVQLTATSYDGLDGLAWTPDGKIVYTSQIAGEQNLWITDARGGAPRQLTAHAGFSEQPTVSPDGRFIVFISNRDGDQHLWRMDLDGKHPMKLTSGFSDKGPTFVPDARLVIFRSSNPSNLFSVSIDGGDPVRLTDKITFDPNVSADGKLIACGYRPGPTVTSKIAVLDIGGGDPKFISDLPVYYGRMRWSPDGKGVAYAAKQEGVGNIWIQPLDGGPAKQLTHWAPSPIYSFGWSADGKLLAYASGSLTSDVVLISDVAR